MIVRDSPQQHDYRTLFEATKSRKKLSPKTIADMVHLQST